MKFERIIKGRFFSNIVAYKAAAEIRDNCQTSDTIQIRQLTERILGSTGYINTNTEH